MRFIVSWLIHWSALLPCIVVLILISRWESLFTNKYNEMCFSRSFILVWYWIRWVKRLFLLVLVEPPTWCGRCLYEVTPLRLRISRCTGHWRVAVPNASSTIRRLLRKTALQDLMDSLEILRARRRNLRRAPPHPVASVCSRRKLPEPHGSNILTSSRRWTTAAAIWRARASEAVSSDCRAQCFCCPVFLWEKKSENCHRPPFQLLRIFFCPCMKSKRLRNFSRQNVLTTNIYIIMTWLVFWTCDYNCFGFSTCYCRLFRKSPGGFNLDFCSKGAFRTCHNQPELLRPGVLGLQIKNGS